MSTTTLTLMGEVRNSPCFAKRKNTTHVLKYASMLFSLAVVICVMTETTSVLL